MAQSTSEVGRRVYKGTAAENTAAVTPIAITAAIGIVLPAKSTGNAGANGKMDLAGVLECNVVIEGTAVSRYTTNGITPTGAVGQLVAAPTATAPVSILLRGQDVIASFLIIGAGNTMTYEFYTSDTRI